MKITAVILTKNEEENIERALKSVMFCDEIIIVDDYSVDSTVEKIRNPKSEIRNTFKILIYKRKLNDNFAAQRNFGMEKAKREWVLFVDADEEVTKELQGEIQSVIGDQLSVIGKNIKLTIESREATAVFRIRRRDFFWGRELRYGEIKKRRNLGIIRLFKKNSGKWLGKVHEEFSPIGRPSFGRKVKTLQSYLNHYPHPTVKDFLREINFYSTLRAKELLLQEKNVNIFEIIFYPLGKFLLTYFIKLGFLDGSAGFTYAFLMSFHSFLVRAKLFQYKRLHPQGVKLTSAHPEGV